MASAAVLSIFEEVLRFASGVVDGAAVATGAEVVSGG
jgi:hypothetical protein